MTWSLQLRAGDLNPAGARGYQVVSGTPKLMQDLRGWLLEPRGSDPFHAEYGSILDGQSMPDGTTIPTYIGATNDNEQAANIESEIRRILLAYQLIQKNRLERESFALAGKNTFSPGELLYSVSNIEMKRFQDVVLASINIITSGGRSVTLLQPV